MLFSLGLSSSTSGFSFIFNGHMIVDPSPHLPLSKKARVFFSKCSTKLRLGSIFKHKIYCQYTRNRLKSGCKEGLKSVSCFQNVSNNQSLLYHPLTSHSHSLPVHSPLPLSMCWSLQLHNVWRAPVGFDSIFRVLLCYFFFCILLLLLQQPN